MEYLTVSYGGVEWDVRGEYVPYREGRSHLPNGDPGYDDEGGYLDGLEISIGGQDITEYLDDRVVYAIEDEAMKQVSV